MLTQFLGIMNCKGIVKFCGVRTLTRYVMAKLHVSLVQFRTQRMNADRVRLVNGAFYSLALFSDGLFLRSASLEAVRG